MYITAYCAIADPITVKLPIYESIESLYDHVDSFVFFDCSKYDKIDLSRYGKVRKHVHGIFNPFDNPFGSMFTSALRLADSDTVLFLDIDEIFEFHVNDLKTIVGRYPLENGAGVSFSLLNYYCDRYHKADGCSSKGPHVFRNRPDLAHDLLKGYAVSHNHIRRTNHHPDACDGVRVVNGEGLPMPQYEPIPLDVVSIHHTSHLDPISKMVRSILQFNHTSTLDLPMFFPFDMRFRKEAVDLIYEKGLEDLKSKEFELYTKPLLHDYKPNALLEKFIERAEIYEFDPTDYPITEQTFTGCVTPQTINQTRSNDGVPK